MNSAETFAWEQNLSRFSAQLFAETDPARLELLRNLLIREENRYGVLTEGLEKADRLILEAKVRIERQKDLVSDLDGAGSDCIAAQSVLATMNRTLELFRQHRDDLAQKLNASRL